MEFRLKTIIFFLLILTFQYSFPENITIDNSSITINSNTISNSNVQEENDNKIIETENMEEEAKKILTSEVRSDNNFSDSEETKVSTKKSTPRLTLLGNLEIDKKYVSPVGGYIPGQAVTYTITIKNKGILAISAITVTDSISSQTTTNINGNTIPAYTSWTTQAVASGGIVTGIVTGLQNNNNIGDVVVIAGGATLTYTVVAIVNPNAVGNINNSVTAGLPILGSTTVNAGPIAPLNGIGNITSTKTYTGPSAGYTPGSQVTYSLVVNNTGTSVASGVPVIDSLTSQTTTDINGSTIPAYTSWTITSVKTGSVSGNSTGITTSLNDSLVMGPNSKVTYTITATVNPNAVGNIGNTAIVNGINITDPAGLKGPSVLGSNIISTKVYTGPSSGYTPGSQVTYNLVISNTGTSLATGVPVIDNLSSQTTTDINGNTISAYTGWTITSSKTGSLSGNSTGVTANLNDTLIMGIGSTVTYVITATVNPNAVGGIGNTANVNGINVTDPGGLKGPSTAGANVTATKVYTGPSSGYTPGGQVTYSLVVNNTGTSLASGVAVLDSLSLQTTTDINGSTIPAYTNWTITSSKTGLLSGNSTGISTNLNDTLIMSAGSKVTYTITATVNPNAVGNIGNTAVVNGINITDPAGLKGPSTLGSNITSTKTYTGPSAGYTPGGQVTYSLVVNNTGTSLASGVTVLDSLSLQTTTDINGSTIPAYTSWTITSSKTGSAAGNSTGIITNLNDTLLMGAGSKVTYIITATVNPNAVGNIGNTAIVNGINITDPAGLKGPSTLGSNITSTKTYTGPVSGYTPGSQITYSLVVSNTGTNLAIGVPVLDNLSSQTTTNINGNTIPAYTGWTITSNKTGSVSGNSTGITTNLNDTLIIGPLSTVTYTITATVNPNAVGNVGNTANVNNINVSNPGGSIGPSTLGANIGATKVYTGPVSGYTPGSQVTYSLVVSNTGTSLATGVPVIDNLSLQTTKDINGNTIPAYSAWTITSSKNGSVSGNSTGITTDLNDTLTLGPLSTVTYTITATVNSGAVGNIGNTAKVNGVNITDPGGLKGPSTLGANITSTKTYTGPVSGYTPGGQVTYSLVINNTGTSLATGVSVIDSINSQTTTDINGNIIAAYTGWTITSNKTGSVSGNSNGITTNLNDTLIIGAGSKVTYIITATVNPNAIGGIGNTAIINGVNTTDPGGLKGPSTIGANISATKTYTGPSSGYTPGGQVSYSLVVKNTGTTLAIGVPIIDDIALETTTDINGLIIPAYTSWTITSVKTGLASGNNTGITTSLSDLLTLGAGSTVTYTITATVNSNAVGNIGNTANVNGINITDPGGLKGPSTIGANVSATKVYTGPSSGYTPGGQVTYSLVVNNTGTSLAVGVPVLDSLSLQTTTDINGLVIPAYSSWTITSSKTGSVSGNSTGITTNLNDILLMGTGSSVTYTVTAVVNPNAVGNIGNTANVNGVNITDPAGPKGPTTAGANISATKTYTGSPSGYIPGGEVTYSLVVSNTGTSLATGVSVIDNILSETTTDINGASVAAYTSWVITSVKTGSVSGNKTGIITNLNDTLTMGTGSTVTYTITAVVNPNAVGNIGNTAKVNGTDITNPGGLIGPSTTGANIISTKVYNGPLSGYTPGSQVNYTLTVSNTGTNLAIGVPVIDNLSSETTTDINGNTVSAYTNWTITSTKIGLVSGNKTGITTNLNDTLTMGTGSTVIYTITATVNPNAVGGIGNTANVNGINITDPGGLKGPSEAGANISATKLYTGPISGYTPGSQVTYSLVVDNTGTSIATGVSVVDSLSSQVTTDINGNTISAYTDWTITSSKTGSASGNSTGITTNLNDTLTIGAGSSVTYTITATVNSNAVGGIGNKADVNGVNVTDPRGLIGPTTQGANITATKIYTGSLSGYVPGEHVVYELVVSNTGTNLATGVSVTDTLLSQITTDINGNTIPAYTNWAITSAKIGSVSGNSTGITTNLNDTLTIGVGSTVTYTITATVNPNAVGGIGNKASVNGIDVVNTGGLINPSTLGANISATKTYTGPSSGYIPGNQVTYSLVVSNTGTNLATGISVIDNLSSHVTTDINGQVIPAYTSWSVTSSKTGSISGNSTGITTNLNDVLIIGAGSTITYTITATVNPNAAGEIGNTANVNGINITDPGGLKGPSTLGANVTATKLYTGPVSGYTPGSKVTYSLTVSNTGTSIAIGVPVIDNLSLQTTKDINGNTISAYTDWTITSSKIGAASGNSTGNTSNLNDTLTIGAGSTVIYTISATVNPNAVGLVGNTANINGVNISDPGGPTGPSTLGANISATKVYTGSASGYTPGGQVTYDLVVRNTGTAMATGVSVIDNILSEITTDINGGTIAAYTGWTITSSKTGSVSGNSTGITTNLNDVLTIGSGSTVTYTIKATVNPNAVGNIGNTAIVNGLEIKDPSGLKGPSTLGANITATKVYTGPVAGYTPGSQITYNLIVSNTGTSLATGVLVLDDVLSQTTLDINGGTIAAYTDWTITSNKVGMVSGNSTGITTNLNDTLTIGPASIVTYTITATVNPNAVGGIGNTANVNGVNVTNPGGLIDPTEAGANVTATKVYTGPISGYTPGSHVTYSLVVSNTGTNLATGVPVIDNLSSETTTDINGSTISAYTDWTIISTEIGSIAGNSTGITTNLNDTLTIGPASTVTYLITATVNPNATGKIGNTAKVNGVNITNPGGTTGPSTLGANITATKTYTGPAAGYTPGSQVTYSLAVSNTGTSLATVIPVIDNLSLETTTDIDGNTISAYTGWTITSSKSGLISGNSTGITTNLNDVLTIQAGATITYTITATVNPNAVGSIGNTANINGIDITDPGGLIGPLTSGANITAAKIYTGPVSGYTPGSQITYSLVVNNTGTSLAKGISVIDNLSSEVTTDINGNTIASYSNWTITSSKLGSVSGNSTGITTNLNDNLTLGPGSSVTYIITATVNADAVGNIGNTANVNGTNVTNPGGLISPSELGTNISATKTYTGPVSGYTPGSHVTYSLVVSNIGTSLATGVSVIDSLSLETTKDINGNTISAYTDWTIISSKIGAASGNSTGIVTDLNDTLIIGPGSSVTYVITATVNPNAVENIGNTAKVNGVDIKNPGGLIGPSTSGANITATKVYTGPVSGYTPGSPVTYNLIVSNTGTNLATGVSVVDNILSETTTDINGSTISAYTDWTITSVKTGIVSGNSTGITTNLNDTLTLGPASIVTYTITATVNPNATGNIGNTAKINGVDTTNPGGLIGPSTLGANITAAKVYTGPVSGYTPGNQVTYSLVVSNTGTSIATGVPVIDNLSSETTTDINGALIPAYTSWVITSTKIGLISGNSTGITTNLNDTLTLGPASIVTYTITAVVNEDAVGNIGNTAKVNGLDVTDPGGLKGPSTLEANVTAAKVYTGPVSGYTPGSQVTYSLVVSNTGTSIAMGVPVLDNLSSETTTDINGNTIPAYTSWTITSNKTGIVSGNSTGIATNLNDTLTIGPASTVTYTITAIVNQNATGNIGNTAKVNGLDVTDPGGSKGPSTTGANISSTKVYTGPVSGYTPGSQVTYSLVVSNTGTSLATGVSVLDDISSETTTDINGGTISAYTSWSVTSSKTGLVSGNSTGITTNLNDTLIMETGSTVIYTITAVVNPNAVGNIGNTAKVNGIDVTNPGGLTGPSEAGTNVTATKVYTGPVLGYTPGEQVTYSLVVRNTGTSVAVSIPVIDNLSSETTTDINGSTISSYTNWTITSVKSGSASGNSTGIITNLNDVLTIGAGSEVTYTITATVNPNAVGSIGNTAKVNGIDVTDPGGLKGPSGLGANITAAKVYTGPVSGYTPGEQVTYSLTVSNTGTSVATGVTVLDNILSETTTDINGNTISAYTGWTIVSSKTGLVSGNSTGITTNLSDTLTIGAGSAVTYIITATVNPNAIGDIGNTAKVNGVDVMNPGGLIGPTTSGSLVTATKIYTGPVSGYTPGSQVTYSLVVNNTGTSVATGVSVIDELSAEITEDINGNTIPAYTNWTITSSKTGSVSGNSTGITTNLSDTLIIGTGSTVTYTITAVVNPNAVGGIGNTATVNGANISIPGGLINPSKTGSNITATKIYTGPVLGYVPGEQVTYSLVVNNTGISVATGVPVIDNLSLETTTDINGNTISAYTNWTITSAKSGLASGNSTGITTNLNDTLIVGAGSAVTYTITATVNPNAVGNIGNTANVNGTNITDPGGTKGPSGSGSNITAVKTYTGPISGYTPGGQVTYSLVINNAGLGLATGVAVIDSLSSETTTDINGNTVASYTSWTITSSKTGSISGNSTGITTNLNDTLIMGTGSTVTYTITAVVNPNAVGGIGNTANVNGVNVTDPGGLKGPTTIGSNIAATKVYTGPVAGYTPGSQVTYDLVVSNTGTNIATGVSVIDNLSSQTTTDIGGGIIPAYTNWTITSVKTGSVSGNSTGVTIDLNDTLTIGAGSTVIYTITATVDPNAVGGIGNTANVNGVNISNPGGLISPSEIGTNVTATKVYTGPVSGYTPGSQITYNLVVSNIGTSVATGVSVIDNISAESTTDINGNTISSYTNWTITSVKTGLASGNSTGITTNLNDVLTIGAGSAVTYTITATVNPNALGNIGNTANVNGVNVTDPGGLTGPSTTGANITATKTYTGPVSGYTPGGQVSYDLVISNIGTNVATGVSVVDNILSETTTDINGNIIPAYSAWTITSSKTGAASGNSTGITTNLNDTLTVGAGSTVIYKITAVVNQDAVGGIGNTAQVNGKNITNPGGLIDLSVLGVNITSTKTYTGPVSGYTPGSQVTYELVVSNTGTSAANGISVIDNLSSQTTTDINGNTISAYTSWTIESSKIGLASGNSTGIITNLNDTLKIGANSKVTYTITAVVNPNAVGGIGNTANVNGVNVTDPGGLTGPSATGINITSTKTYTGPVSGYTPGSQVTYSLVVNNTGTGVAVGIPVIDDLSLETTTDINGSLIQAYTNWTITSVKTGAISGNSTGISTNLNDILTIGAGSTVTYTITATVNSNAVGNIGNTAKVNGVNITNPGGLIGPSTTGANITAIKTYTGPVSGYTPGSQITYDLVVSNTGTSIANGVSVIDDILSETTTDINGGIIASYTGWVISSSKTGLVSGNSTGITTNLNDTLIMGAGSVLTYTITATVNPNAVGGVGNTAKVNGVNVTDPGGLIGPSTAGSNITATKVYTGPVSGYTPGSQVTYDLVISNTGTSVASGVSVIDNLSSETTTDIGGGTISSYTSWTIISSKTGSAAGNSSGITTDLNDTLTIQAGSTVTYIISATVNPDAVGNIGNTAKVNGVDVTNPGGLTGPSAAGTNITATKVYTGLISGYTPGSQVTYDLVVSNTGTSVASGVSVIDNLSLETTTDISGSTISAYTNWTITSIKTGSVSGNSTGIITDLNDTLVIGAGSKVTYKITATVNPNAAGGIGNTANVNGVNITDPGGLKGPSILGTNITSTKTYTGPVSGYTPGSQITYDLVVSNTGTSVANGVSVIDNLSSETTTDINGNTISAYTSWIITSSKTGLASGNSTGLITNLNDTIAIGAGSAVTYTITAIVNPNAAGGIGNTANVNGINVTDPGGLKGPSTLGSNITSTKTYTGPVSGYTPGSQVTYSLVVNNTGTSLATAVPVIDNLSSETTTDINGGTIAAYTSWTITSSKIGTVSGNSSGITTNLNDTLVIGAGSTVTYTITATVNPDATGNIGNTAKVNGINTTDPGGTVGPTSGGSNVTATKTYTGPVSGYTPGAQITYNLVVSNTGAGVASGVSVKDNMSLETTTDTNGNIISAYTSWSITSSKTGSVSGNSTGITTDLNDTLIIGPNSTVTYTITAVVNQDAVGVLGNTAKVNGINVTDPGGSKGPSTSDANIVATKTYTGPVSGYIPGSQVTYSLVINNTGTSMAIGVPVIDNLSTQTTTDINGNTISAYTGWTITSSKTGSASGNSTGIITNLNDVLTVGAGSTVTYVITATVNPDAVGAIGNTANVSGINVTDPGGPVGPSTGGVNITSTKTYTGPISGYTPGSQVTYDLVVSNTGASVANGVSVLDNLSSETTTDIGGNIISAYTNWTITSNKTGSVSGNSTGITTNLNDTLIIGPNSTVTYTITATVNPNATGGIGNTAKVDGQNITDPGGLKGPSTVGVNVTATKTYTGPSSGYTPGGQITYDLVISNAGTSVATGVTVMDNISSETTTDINGSVIAAYTGWTITSSKIGSASGNSTGITTDLNDILTIGPNSTVTYVITATVNPDAVGGVGNTAKVDGVNITDPGGVKGPVTGGSNITATKTYTGPVSGYTPGSQVTYSLVINNTGTSLATGVTVIDNLLSETTTNISGGTIAAYTNWTITSSKTGSVSGNSSGITTNLNDTLTMGAGSTVTYVITAVVNPNAVGGIGNTAKVNGTNITDPGGLKGISTDGTNVTATKTYTGPVSGYTPGSQVTYNLVVSNTGVNPAIGIPVIDNMSAETTTDINGNTISAYTNWTITSSKTGSVSGNSSGITTNLNDTLIMGAGSTVTYTITASVNSNAVGNVGNTANVNGNNITDPNGYKGMSIIGSNITATKIYKGPSTGYIPGEQVTYDLVVSNTGTNIATGVTVVDNISGEITKDMEGNIIPAYTSWTISSGKTGTILGNSTGITTDLNDTLTIGTNSTITYTITATVNPIAFGEIGNTAKVNGTDIAAALTGPLTGKNITAKIETITTFENGYIPGDIVMYKITIENKENTISIGNVIKNISLEQKAKDIYGTTVKAFESWEIKGTVVNGNVYGMTQTTTLDLNDTLNFGPNAKIEYIIKGVIAKDIYDEIINTGYFNGQKLESLPIKPKVGETNLTISISASKDIVELGDTVEYTVKVYNNGKTTEEGLNIKNLLPIGFNYIDETIDTKTTDSNLSILSKGDFVLGTFNLKPKEEMVVTYIVKIGTTIQTGRYTTSAVTMKDGKEVTNIANVTVQVVGNGIANKASVIGKVFEDVNGDGIQNDATARNIVVKNVIDNINYISNTAELIMLDSNNHELSKQKIPDNDFASGIKIDKLVGKSLNNSFREANKVIIRAEIKEPNIEESFMTIMTKEGMNLSYKNGIINTSESKGDVKSGITTQEFYISRERKYNGVRYIEEVTIENVGIQEEGIAGVKLKTPSGITIITDEFGRYHVPDEYVEKERGKNFIIKLDKSSLPKGMKIISENPKIKLITQYGLNVINFRVQFIGKGE